MEKNSDKKNNNVIITILAIVVVLLLVVCIRLGIIIANGEYKECNKDIVQDKINDTVQNYMPLENNEYDVYIDIFSIDKPSIISISPNHHLYVSGDMNISFKEENFHIVGLEGYCLGDKNEKYMIYGPSTEIGMSFKNGDTVFELVETIGDEDGDVRYSDGTVKSSSEVVWENVKIKSCKIEKLYTVYTKDGKTVTSYTELDYEEQFD